MFKEQVLKTSKELEHEKAHHSKTQTSLTLKIERLRIAEGEKRRFSTSPKKHRK